jgi:hypothetical protein
MNIFPNYLCDWHCIQCYKSFADQDCYSMLDENTVACPDCRGPLEGSTERVIHLLLGLTED